MVTWVELIALLALIAQIVLLVMNVNSNTNQFRKAYISGVAFYLLLNHALPASPWDPAKAITGPSGRPLKKAVTNLVTVCIFMKNPLY